jgi:hypothetical protein
MSSVEKIDSLIQEALRALAADPHIKQWQAKEHNWVSYFAMRHVLEHCEPGGVLSHPAQIGIEVGVPQPPGYKSATTRRDLVIWPNVGMTCWNDSWMASCHPLAIVEWKVHRPGRKNRFVDDERNWLRSYCVWQPTVVAYAVEVDGAANPIRMTCSRFVGREERSDWLKFEM